MLILPNTMNWNEGETDWSFVPDPKNDIKNWEVRFGRKLPSDYKEFLLRFNGGSVYPRMFKHAISPSTLPSVSQEEILDRLYRWDQVVPLYNREGYGKGLPDGYLDIGETPGPLEILLSIREEDFGKIYAWVRSSNRWGTDSNTEIYLLAANFRTFLKMLYDDQEKTDYMGWFIPGCEDITKELEVDSL